MSWWTKNPKVRVLKGGGKKPTQDTEKKVEQIAREVVRKAKQEAKKPEKSLPN